MRRLHRLARGVASLFSRHRHETELDEELREFLQSSIDAKIASGMPRAAAERAARLELGSAAAVKDWTRDVGWESHVGSLWQDVRYALRLMIRAPAFSVATLVTVAVGTGAVIAVYSVAYGVLLRPLPVSDEGSLAVLYRVDGTRENGPISFPRFEAWRDSGVFTDLAAVSQSSFDVTSGGLTERAAGEAVSASFFRLVGITPSVGRLLDERDSTPAGDAVPAVLSHALWTRRFGGDPAVVGRRVPTGTDTLVIVGIAPEGFERWRGDAHLWVPIQVVNAPRVLSSDGYNIATPVARLRPDVSPAMAQDRLLTVNRAFDERHGQERVDALSDVRLVMLREDVVPETLKRGIVVLLLAVSLTWFVVCSNVANLLLGRGAQRASEFAVRLALGAHRSRVMRQLLVESIVLVVPAGIAGLAIAHWGVQLLVAFGPLGVVGNEAVRVDAPVVLAAAALVIVTVLGCGALPAIRLSRGSIRAELGLRSAPSRVSTLLLGIQFSLAVVVLIGAMLLVKSVWRISGVDLGFRAENVLTVRFQFLRAPGGSAASDTGWRHAAQQAIVERLGALPGIERVTVSDSLFRPTFPVRWSISLNDGRRFLNGEPDQRAFTPRPHVIGPEYFRIHGVPVLEGREFTAGDRDGSTPVVVINRTMAEMLWPGQTAIGHRLNFGRWSPRKGFDEPWHEIVGVAADMRYGGVEEPFLPEVYRSAGQAPLPVGGYAVLETRVQPERVVGLVREQLSAVDSRIAVHPPRPLDDIVAESTALTRYNSALLGVCALMTGVLSAFGIYSLLAYAVASMRRELSIRFALGAAPRRLAWEVLVPALAALIPGAGVGLVLAAVLAPALASVLFEVSPRDPTVFGGAASAVVLVGLSAAWLAARRAGQVDPIIALRAE